MTRASKFSDRGSPEGCRKTEELCLTRLCGQGRLPGGKRLNCDRETDQSGLAGVAHCDDHDKVRICDSKSLILSHKNPHIS